MSLITVTTVILAYPDIAIKGTLSGGVWESTLPRTHLLTRDLDEVARTVDTATSSTTVTLTLDRVRPVRVLVLPNHNLSIDARYRWVGRYTPGGSDTVYDTGWADVWPTMFDNSTLPWESLNWWDGRIDPEDMDKYPRNLIVVLPDLVAAGEWTLQIDDVDNPDDYIESGLLFVAGQWQPKWNRSYGYRKGHKPLTTVSATPVGRVFCERNTPLRIATLPLDWLDAADAATLYDMQRLADVSDWMMFIPNASDALNLYRDSFLARFADLAEIERHLHGYSRAQVPLIEVI